MITLEAVPSDSYNYEKDPENTSRHLIDYYESIGFKLDNQNKDICINEILHGSGGCFMTGKISNISLLACQSRIRPDIDQQRIYDHLPNDIITNIDLSELKSNKSGCTIL